jgi:hypothetical protein
VADAKTLTLNRWIIIRNGDECRLVTKRPDLYANEVAVRLVLNVPQPPRVVATVTIDMPEPLPVEAEAEVEAYG